MPYEEEKTDSAHKKKRSSRTSIEGLTPPSLFSAFPAPGKQKKYLPFDYRAQNLTPERVHYGPPLILPTDFRSRHSSRNARTFKTLSSLFEGGVSTVRFCNSKVVCATVMLEGSL
ncbi:hypothetical protein CDAR_457291 [Caerostris darwini]|uniref:Uncharacterized protein n=1 Tax=Caerostris darwini TaxID=1538125 RepID=A0AAV4PEP8_9ARAC|nr:hypothetical protein CDAR_457291 [Caerostris darwini]